MFWIIILIIIAGVLLIKLGALSVLVTVLAVSLKVVIGFIAFLGLLMIWIQSRKPSPSPTYINHTPFTSTISSHSF